MKQLFIVALFIGFFSSYSQYKIEDYATTQDEYNYASKGYSISVETGLDVKKGYFVRKLTTRRFSGENARSVEIIGLFRETMPQVPCAYIVITGKNANERSFFCFPSPNSDVAIWQQCYEDFTRHKSLGGLKSYLRDIGAFLPKDYSSMYSIDF